ncbi:MAG: GNAT family N-acetyltransferase [bacterium]|nr:GNAT family N-acetyltransferase [bacterium]
MHPDYTDPVRRAALYRLLDITWPGVARKIETAARYGWNWDEQTTPFARFDGDLALSHVGVLDLPLLLDGAEHRVAGVHAVCTDPGHRRRGHYRAVMEHALEFIDARWKIAKLHCSRPELYEPFGFRVVPLNRFELFRSGAGNGTARKLGEADLNWIRERLQTRSPSSVRHAVLESGWLLGIDEVLWTGDLDHLYAVDDDTLVAWDAAGGTLNLYEVATRGEPDLDTLLAACPWPFERVVFWITPDRFAPEARPIDWLADDILMVRGDWPVEGPFAISPLTSH